MSPREQRDVELGRAEAFREIAAKALALPQSAATSELFRLAFRLEAEATARAANLAQLETE